MSFVSQSSGHGGGGGFGGSAFLGSKQGFADHCCQAREALSLIEFLVAEPVGLDNQVAVGSITSAGQGD